MQRYRDIPLIFTTATEFYKYQPSMLKFQPTLNSSRNLTAEREEKRKRKKKELNNFCVSHSFMNHSSRGQRKNLCESIGNYFIYEWESYWVADTRDLTPNWFAPDTVEALALTTLLVAFLLAGSRRMPKGFVFKCDLFVFKLLLVQTMCLILFTTSARLLVACVTN